MSSDEVRDDPSPPPDSSGLWRGDEAYRRLVESVTDYAIFLLDAEGRVASWNEGARRLKGYSDEEITGRSFRCFYPQEALDRGWPEHELEVAREAGRFEDEGWRLRKDGSRFWANVVITPLRDEAGSLRGYSKITRDWTARRAEEDALRRTDEQLRLLVDAVQDYAMYLLDPQGRIVSWNTGAARIKGFRSDEVIGTHFRRFYAPEDAEAGKPERALAHASRFGTFDAEGWRVRRDGSRFWAHASLTALRNPEGTLLGFAKITRDLTQRRTVEKLEDARRQMNEFLAMLAHELRNPLAPIRNAVELMRRSKAEDRLALARDVIERQVVHLSRLVDDLLDVGRITTGKIALNLGPVSLQEVVARGVETSQSGIAARSQHLAVEVADAPIPLSADLVRLAQVVGNLLNNASKYTPTGGTITLAVFPQGGAGVLRVTDTGDGIAPELLNRVFDLFVQGERTLDRTDGGLGVGLTVARRLVEMHGGTITAESDGPGQGSRFTVRLPIASDRVVDPPGRRETVGASGGVRRVLVVDDNRDSADSMAALLRAAGHLVEVAYDGQAAVAVADTFAPEFVLLDLGLPRMDGFEVAAHLRRFPSCSRTAIVAMTGYGQPDDVRRTRDAGFVSHLVKPVDSDRLFALLATSAG